MAIIFNPDKIIRKVIPKSIIKNNLQINAGLKKSLLRLDFLTNKDVNKTINSSLTFYKNKMRELKAAGEPVRQAAADAVNDGRLLETRLENMIIQRASEDIKKRFAGKRYVWLPSSSENPDPKHQLNYGKIFIVGEGEMPGERWGCKCGMEILDVEDEDTPDIFIDKSQRNPYAPLMQKTRFNKRVEQAYSELKSSLGKGQDAIKFKPIQFNIVESADAGRLLKETGTHGKYKLKLDRNLTGYVRQFDNVSYHVLNSHGNTAVEVAKGQRVPKLKDFKLIPRITKEFDRVWIKRKGGLKISYEKTIGEERFVYTEAVSNYGDRKLSVKSLRIHTKKK